MLVFFNGCILNIKEIVDNDYANNFVVTDKDGLSCYGIDSDSDDRVKAYSEYSELYLVEIS